MEEKFKQMFEPIKIGKLEIKNKFFMAPMGPPAACGEHGTYTPESIEYYVQRAKGGIGLIVTGANWVENEVEEHGACLFPCPNTLPALYEKRAREMNDRVHAYGAKIFVQLTAGLGRSGIPGLSVPTDNLVAPSETTNRWNDALKHRELTTEEIEYIVKQFGKAAHTAKTSGFDGIEIHAVHEGYLLDCFAMALFNQRTDKYGGDLRGRLRFATEIVEEIKRVCGKDYPVIMRFSIKSYIKAIRQGGLPGEEFEELGRDVDESLEVARILEEAGYDGFDADAGTYDSWYWAHPPMYFEKGLYLPLAAKLKEVATVPVMVAGRMDDIEKSADALQAGVVDMIGLGRPVLSDPEFVNKVRSGNTRDIRPCLGCHDGCFGRLFEGGVGSCAVNPECGREINVGISKADEIKNIVVIGGGPAGMEAARVSAIRGHKVTLIEQREQLGGSLVIAGVPKFKEDDLALIEWYKYQMEKLGVDVRLNTKATPEMISKLQPDGLFVAEGSVPFVPKLEGIEKAVLAQDVLLGNVEVKDNVAIIGGGLVGAELALHLAQQGKKITIVEGLPDILSSGIMLPPMNEWMLRDLLKFNNVAIEAGSMLDSITDEGAVVKQGEDKKLISCDQVVIAIGYRSEKSLYEKLKFDYTYVYNVGDGRNVRNIRAAIWDAYEVARNL